MANKKTQLKERGTGNNLYPVTIAENVLYGDGTIVDELSNISKSHIIKLTKQEYQEITEKNPNTLYITV